MGFFKFPFVFNKQEDQLTRTYHLIEANIFMEATKVKQRENNIIRWLVLLCNAIPLCYRALSF